ncbi:hypothetical protein F5Y14DRAFT_449826 [Nemania sp. NC0429]|nr:hypothetical protein F5Y14DRAFT_449826 [Nemania sp. NC0429]
MCVGIMCYYVSCGHSAIHWRRCQSAGTPYCHRVSGGEEFREEKCGHAWCPCDYRVWACCRCDTTNRWSDCARCRHLRCYSCEAGDHTVFSDDEDPRFLRWRERLQEQERERARASVREMRERRRLGG